jgi:hypothetical protein
MIASGVWHESSALKKTPFFESISSSDRSANSASVAAREALNKVGVQADKVEKVTKLLDTRHNVVLNPETGAYRPATAAE